MFFVIAGVASTSCAVKIVHGPSTRPQTSNWKSEQTTCRLNFVHCSAPKLFHGFWAKPNIWLKLLFDGPSGRDRWKKIHLLKMTWRKKLEEEEAGEGQSWEWTCDGWQKEEWECERDEQGEGTNNNRLPFEHYPSLSRRLKVATPA